jgi:hypothetical protein
MIDISVFLIVVLGLSALGFIGISFFAIDAHDRVEKLEKRVEMLERSKIRENA